MGVVRSGCGVRYACCGDMCGILYIIWWWDKLCKVASGSILFPSS